MLVFIDDSGDPGLQLEKGSSKIFVIALIIFDDSLEAEETALKIKKLRRELGKTDDFEFKFNKCSKELRVRFLKRITDSKFRIQALIIKKRGVLEKEKRVSKESFYSQVIMRVLKYSRGTIKDAKLTLDGRGERVFRKKFTSFLRKELNKPGDKVFKNLKFENSKSNVLLQLADMIAGSINRSFSEKGDAKMYREIIKEREEKIWILGENKKSR